MTTPPPDAMTCNHVDTPRNPEHLHADANLQSQHRSHSALHSAGRIKVRTPDGFDMEWNGKETATRTQHVAWRLSAYLAMAVAFLGVLQWLVQRKSADETTPRLRQDGPVAASALANKDDARLPAGEQPCCRICRRGKACGDACIPADAECHEPPGCACQAAPGK